MAGQENSVRVRFAPSPTGYLHVGGARTALFCWLFAKRHQGHFLLRIEDTDRERSTQESIQAILDGMAWLGLDYDEGPIFQTDRLDRYRAVATELQEAGAAYYCDCSKERLETVRREQMEAGRKPRYDGCCREKGLSSAAGCVLRFRCPDQECVTFHDCVHGEITTPVSELDDLVLVRSDGMPTYNFTVVVDDSDMEMTHVIRGDDHINNTPRQLLIYQALNRPVPIYAHVPMILGDDGKRLSKRHGAVSVLQYREAGYLPEALLNYLVRLGWAHGDQELFSIDEMVSFFDLSDISGSQAMFDHEKLQWVNQHYIKESSPYILADVLKAQLVSLGVDTSAGPDCEAVVRLQSERAKTLREMAEKSVYFFQEVTSYNEKAVKKHCKGPVLEVLQDVRHGLSALSDWAPHVIHQVVLQVAEKHDVKLGRVAQPLRIAMTGDSVSPPIDETLYLIGRERVIERIGLLVAHLESMGVTASST